MSIEPGGSLLHYRIAEKIGEGGMGVVWKAVDTSLDRDVAIKVLPEALAAEQDRLARFEREAKLLASLNHPNIASVYGLHEHEGTRFIAMELVPGEDLAAVIGRGAIAVESALEIAGQIADALEIAHEQGVIHRDLKPANIKITPDGKVKVLDFGLAKAFEADPSSANAAPTMSPTLTSAGTVAGMILGTAAYMSPQQARGHAVDKRADIWAFGCVLYEMLTGALAFPGETVSDTLASVLKLEPDWDALPADTPPRTRRLLERCLEKDARKRLRDIGEARIRIDHTLSGEAVDVLADRSLSRADAAPQPARRSKLPWAIAAVSALIALGAILAPFVLDDAPPPPPTMRFELALPESLDVSSAGSSIVLSPDGERIAYVGGELRQLHVRRIGDLSATTLSGTEDSSQPFFSPDGQSLGFFADGELKKVSVLGGAAVALAEVQSHRGASWGEDGSIVYCPNVTSGLYRIADVGGEPEALTTVSDDSIRSHRWPDMLPGGKGVLLTVQPNGATFDDARIEAIDLVTGDRTVVAEGGSYPRYAPSGHVTYVHEGTLFAIGFDVETLTPIGAPVPVIENVLYDRRNGGAKFDFTPDGNLVYLTGGSTSTEFQLAWIAPDGTHTPVLEEIRDYGAPRLSPDGEQLAVHYSPATGTPDIWVYDLRRRAMTRLTFHETFDLTPVWTPDGADIVFSSLRDASVPNLQRKRADGSNEAERLTDSTSAQFASSISADGAYLLYAEEGAETQWDLRTMRLEDGEIEVYLQTPFNERTGEFSPDGEWVAYASDESGRFEVYVRPFPSGGGRWQISNEGGNNPIWSRDGSRLYYLSDGALMVAGVSVTGDTLRAESPDVAIERGMPSDGLFRPYDIAIDDRVVGRVRPEHSTVESPRAMLVLNWFDELP